MFVYVFVGVYVCLLVFARERVFEITTSLVVSYSSLSAVDDQPPRKHLITASRTSRAALSIDPFIGDAKV